MVLNPEKMSIFLLENFKAVKIHPISKVLAKPANPSITRKDPLI